MKSLLTILLTISLCTFLTAQKSEEQALFDRGVQEYKSGQYQTSERIFLELVQKYGDGRLITATRLMLAKSYYQLGDYGKAEVLAEYFLKRHENSRYTADIHFLLAKVYFQRKENPEAVREWLWVIRNSSDASLRSTAAQYAYNTLIFFVDNRQLTALKSRENNPAARNIFDVAMARKLMDAGEFDRARSILNKVLREQPDGPLSAEARLLTGTRETTSGSSTPTGQNGVLFLKSASPDTRDISLEMEMGMKYALYEHKQRNRKSKISLRTVDIEPTVISAITSVTRETRRSNPVAVIGPIDSDQSAGLALLSRYEKFPFLIPLSSQPGLTDVSDYAFQINPDVSAKGAFTGQYVAKTLGAKRIAILAPVNDYGKGYVESFVETVQSEGGEVLAAQWYYENAVDFTKQFREIRKQSFYASFLDSLYEANPEFPEAELREEYRQYIDRVFKPLRPGAKVDSTDIPATGIDAVLIIIPSSDFVEYIAPQIAFNHIEATIVGNEGWNDPEQLRKFRNQIDGLTMITQGYLDPNAWSYKEFVSRFRGQMQTTPNEFHVLGYDIMSWALQNYQDGASRDDFRKSLERSRLYQGIAKNIQFPANSRINNQLTVLRLNLGQIVKLN